MRLRRGADQGDVAVLEPLDDAESMEDLIETLSIMAEQNVILAKGVQKKVEALRNVREERDRRNAARGARS